MTAEEKKELIEAYKQDFTKLSIDQMKREAPLGLIRFVTVKDAQALAWEERMEDLARQKGTSYRYYRGFQERSFYPVYPSFEQTRQILERHGVVPGSGLEGYEIRSADVPYYVRHKDFSQDSSYNGNYYQEAKHLVISDPKELAELKEAIVLDNMTNYYDPLYPTENLDMSLNADRGKDASSIGVRIPKGKIPGFLQTKIDEGSKIE